MIHREIAWMLGQHKLCQIPHQPMSDPNHSLVIPNVDITFIQSDNSLPIYLSPFLIIFGPPLLSILVGFSEVHNFACFSSMKPSFMQDCLHGTGWDVWGNQFANLVKWFLVVYFGLANDRLLNKICNLWWTSRVRGHMCWANFFLNFHQKNDNEVMTDFDEL